MGNPVVTRFAPSPTGHLHIGGVRTALFCWAYARRHGGRFALRIEDTDQKRSSEEAARGILEDLAWLGIAWDDGPEFHGIGGDDRGVGPFYQAQRLEIYGRYLDRLLEIGRAYPAFETTEELDALRAEAQGRKEAFRYRQRPGYDHAAALARMRGGEACVVRFRMPETPIHVADSVLGDIRFDEEHTDDFVLRKADGFPTYHFAVVVDDELMGVTHVLRGQEHLNNTPRHVALQQALTREDGTPFRTPVYAHMPLIFNLEGLKMSKRDADKVLRNAVTSRIGSVSERRQEFEGLLRKQRLLLKAIDWSADHLNLPAATRNVYRSYVVQTIEHLPNDVLPMVANLDANTLLSRAGMARKWAPSTIAAARAPLKQFLDWLTHDWLINEFLDVGDELEHLNTWQRTKGSQLPPQKLRSLARLVDIELPAITVEDFRSGGYLPAAICNYLALLGWNPGMKNADGTDLERFDMTFICEHFSLDRIGKSNSKFDPEKLLAFNQDVIRSLPAEEFERVLRDWCETYDPVYLHSLGSRFAMAVRAVQPRIKTLGQCREPIAFALVPDSAVEFDEKAVAKVLLKGEPSGLAVLGEFRDALASVSPFEPAPIEDAVKAFCDARALGMGKVAQPVRIAITGGTVSPGLGETLALVGREGALARIDRCLLACTNR